MLQNLKQSSTMATRDSHGRHIVDSIAQCNFGAKLSAVSLQQSPSHTQPVSRTVQLVVHADSPVGVLPRGGLTQCSHTHSPARNEHTSKQLSKSALNRRTKGKAKAGRKATSPSTGAQWVKAERVRAKRRISDWSPRGKSFSKWA